MQSALKGDLWQVRISLADYEPENASNWVLNLNEKEHKISVEEYLGELYVRRQNGIYEANLIREMVSSSRVLCILGAQGSGKTSALLYVLNEINNNIAKYRIKAIYVDMRKHYDGYKSIIDNTTAKHNKTAYAYQMAFRTITNNIIVDRLFGKEKAFRFFLAHLIAHENSTSKQIDSFWPFVDIRNRIIAEADCMNKSFSERRQAVVSLFRHDPRLYSYILKQAQSLVRPVHLFRCYQEIYRRFYDQIVIIWDNIDKLEPELQKSFLDVCIGIQDSSENCHTTIAARTDSVLYREIYRGVEYGIDTFTPDNQKYKGLLVPAISADHMNEAAKKRDAYANKLVEESHINDDELKSTWIPITEYHNSMLNEFMASSIHSIANYSMRTVLKIYIEFIRYIWTQHDNGLLAPKKLKENPKLLQTLFYLFLWDSQTTVGIPLYDVIKVNVKGSVTKESVSIPHLLLTCLFNLTASAKVHSTFPKWSEVSQRLEALGFSYNEIQKALATLMYLGKNSTNSYGDDKFLYRKCIENAPLYFVDRQLDACTIDRYSDERIRIAPLGEELVKNVLHKIGYIWGAALKYEIGEKPNALKSFFEYTYFKRPRIIYDFLKALANQHLRFLALVSINMYKVYNSEWLNYYRAQFGVNNELQCERLLSSAELYFKDYYLMEINKGEKPTFLNPFEILKWNYSALVGQIGMGKYYDQLEISRLDSSDETMQKCQEKILKKSK